MANLYKVTILSQISVDGYGELLYNHGNRLMSFY